MERNRRKPKNDKWMICGFYEVKKTFSSNKKVWLEDRKYIRNYKKGKDSWFRLYLYHKNIKEDTIWVMHKGIKPI